MARIRYIRTASGDIPLEAENAVTFEAQTLDGNQKKQARTNVGAAEQITDASGNQYRLGVENGLVYIEEV